MEPSKIKKHAWVSATVIIIIAVVVSYFVFVQVSITDTEFSDSVENAEQSFNVGNLNVSISELEILLGKDLSDVSRADVLIALASAYAQKGSIEFKETEYGTKALAAINEALLIVPNSSNAYRVMAYAYEIMQDYNKAIPAYETAISLNQNNAMAYSGLGHAYDLIGDKVKAEVNLKEAVRIDPSLDHALYNLAKVNFALQKLSEAEKYARMTIVESKNNRFISEATSLLGLVAMKQLKHKEAVDLFEKAIEADSTLVHNYVFLADAKIALFASGGDLLAIENYDEKEATLFKDTSALIEKAISINPNYTSAYLVKAKILGLSNKRSEVIPTLREGLRVVETDITLSATEKDAMKIHLNETITNYSKQL